MHNISRKSTVLLSVLTLVFAPEFCYNHIDFPKCVRINYIYLNQAYAEFEIGDWTFEVLQEAKFSLT